MPFFIWRIRETFFHAHTSNADMQRQPSEGDIVIFISSQCKIRGAGHPNEVIGRVARDAHGLHAAGRYLESAISDVQILARHADVRSLHVRKPMRMAESTKFKGDIFQIG